MLLRRISVLAWFALPLLAVAWHYGPGQPAFARDHAAAQLATARAAEARADHAAAAQAFAAALAALPPEDPARPAIELEQAMATAASGEILQGINDMEALLQRLGERGEGDGALARATRGELGDAHYNAAWVMRLEGASTEEWTEEADAARQNFRLLAETATTTDEVETSEKNLESTVRLQRLDLSELKGLPLPKKCSCNCKNLSQKKRKQREAKQDGEGKGKKKSEDFRQELKKERQDGANKNARGEGGS